MVSVFKKIPVVLVMLVLIVVNSLFVQGQTEGITFKAKLVTKNLETKIPFELIGGHIVVKTRLNKSTRDYNFVLDTGAIGVVINKDLAKQLKLTKISKKINLGDIIDKPQETGIIRLNELKVGKAKVKDCETAIMDFKNMAEAGLKLDGIIGDNFLSFFTVTIDYQKKELTLSNQNKERDYNPNEYKLKLTHNGMLTTKFKIGTGSCTGFIDTGASGVGSDYLIIPNHLLEKVQPCLNAPVIKSYGITSTGILNESDDAISRVISIELGDLKIPSVPVAIVGDVGILITNDFLSHFTVTIDYPCMEMYILPNGKPFRNNISVLGFKAKRAESGKIKIVGLYEGSVAEKNGLKIGDEITSLEVVKGKQVSEITLEEYHAFYCNLPELTLSLEVANESGRRKIFLKSENIFPES